MQNQTNNRRKACFAGGCFWCIVPVFRELDGVTGVTSGYSGGEEENPTYAEVKKQKTGHRESILVEYDPKRISYGRLLDVFLEAVDPFDGEGQYIDRGHSYTLAVYTETEEEKQAAEARIRDLEKESGKTVMISVEPCRTFYRAEEEHQDYDIKNPEAFAKELEESGRRKKE